MTKINEKNNEIFTPELRKMENAIVAGAKATSDLLFLYVGRAIELADGSRATDIYLADCLKCGRFATQDSGKHVSNLNKIIVDGHHTYSKTAQVLRSLRTMQTDLNLFIIKNNACVFNTDWFLKNEQKEETKKKLEEKKITDAEKLLAGDEVEEKAPTVLERVQELAEVVLENKKATKSDLQEALQEILVQIAG